MEQMEMTTMNLPVLALRGLTIFPGCILTFDVEREISIRALERAMESSLMHPDTMRKTQFLLSMLAERGEDETFRYIRNHVLRGEDFAAAAPQK